MSAKIQLHQHRVPLHRQIRDAYDNPDVDTLAKLVSKYPGLLVVDCALLILELVPLYTSEDQLRSRFKDLRLKKWTRMHEQLLDRVLIIRGIRNQRLRETCWGVLLEKIVYELLKRRYHRLGEDCCTNKKVGPSWNQMTSVEIDVSAWSVPLQQGEFHQCQLSGKFDEHDCDLLEEALALFLKPNTTVTAGLCAMVTQDEVMAKLKKDGHEERINRIKIIGRHALMKLHEAFPGP